MNVAKTRGWNGRGPMAERGITTKVMNVCTAAP
jgi:hypothetical protein